MTIEKIKLLGFLLFSILLATVAQILLKKGMLLVGRPQSYASLLEFFFKAFQNVFVVSGLAIFFLSAMIWLIAISSISLSKAFPFTSINYVLIPLLSMFLFGERLNGYAYSGIVLIVTGLLVFSRGLL